jgi:hypothetical protein
MSESDFKPDLELTHLPQYTGTDEYHGVMGANVTDGIAYLMENGYSWLVTDALVILKMKLKRHEFVSIKFYVESATVIYEDGNGGKLHTQQYETTNATQNLELFYTDGVLLLAQEY